MIGETWVVDPDKYPTNRNDEVDRTVAEVAHRANIGGTLDQMDTAMLLGVSRSHVYSIEKRAKKKIADALAGGGVN